MPPSVRQIVEAFAQYKILIDELTEALFAGADV